MTTVCCHPISCRSVWDLTHIAPHGQIMILLISCFMCIEGYEIYEHCVESSVPWTAYFADRWNYYDWLIVVIFWVVLGMRYSVRAMMRGLAGNAPYSAFEHYSLQATATAAWAEINALAVSAVLVYFKAFKYLIELPYLSNLFSAVRRAVPRAARLLIIFAIALLAYAIAFHLTFATSVSEFRTVWCSLISLLRMCRGDVELASLLAVDPFLAIVLSASFIIALFFVLMSAFVVSVIGARPTFGQALFAIHSLRGCTTKRFWTLTPTSLPLRCVL
jgi:hypothetical protein